LAVALDVGDTAIRIGIQPERDKSGAIVADRKTGSVTLDGVKWTGRRPKSLVKSGDVFYVEPALGRDGEYRLRQIPEVSGACIAMDPFTLRSRMISELPVPLNSSKMTSSIREPVSMSAVAMIVSEPPSSIFLAAGARARHGRWIFI
jgi:hypothetical protein